MAKELLTREELNLLLSDDTESRAAMLDQSMLDQRGGPFSPEDFGTLQKVLATYLIPGVTAWSVLFGRAIELSPPEISLVSAAILTEMDAAVIGEVDFLQGLKGHARFVLPMDGARVLVGLALGSPEPAQEFDLIHRSSFASVLKYLLAEMRSLISRGTGRRVGTSEPVVKLWPEEVLPETGHLVQARIPWWVDGVQHPGLLFWADLELTRGLLGLAAPKAKPTLSPGESAWSGAAMKNKAAPLGGQRGAMPAPPPVRPVGNRLIGRAAQPAAQPVAAKTPAKRGDELSIWTLGRTRGQNAEDDRGPNDPDEDDQLLAPSPPARAPVAAPAMARPAQPAPALPPAPRAAPAPAAAARPTWPTPPANDGPAPESDEQEIRVELGRGTIRDPLALGQVVPLDRLAGESVDIFVDGHLVARGEVTVDGEVLAVRVTQTVPIRRSGRSPER